MKVRVPWSTGSCLFLLLQLCSCLQDPNQPRPPETAGSGKPEFLTATRTRLTVDGHRFRINGALTYAGHSAQGKLMNVRMVNSVFEDSKRTSFDPAQNTDEFISRMSAYVSLGVRAFTLSFQGGYPGYDGAVNTAFYSDGSLKSGYLARVAKVIQKADALGAVIILSLFYQRQDQRLRDDAAVRTAVVNAVRWIKSNGYTNIILEIANEYGHSGFDHPILRSDAGVASLIRLAKDRDPALLVSASPVRSGSITPQVGAASDLILFHLNSTSLGDIGARILAIKAAYPSKPIVCNEDSRSGSAAAAAAKAAVAAGASYGLMVKRNQEFSFYFQGRNDDPTAYERFKALTGY